MRLKPARRSRVSMGSVTESGLASSETSASRLTSKRRSISAKSPPPRAAQRDGGAPPKIGGGPHTPPPPPRPAGGESTRRRDTGPSDPGCVRRERNKSRSIRICSGRTGCGRRCRGFFLIFNDLNERHGKTSYDSSSSLRTAMNASDGTATVPNVRIRFLPSFCFSSSFFLRVISPP